LFAHLTLVWIHKSFQRPTACPWKESNFQLPMTAWSAASAVEGTGVQRRWVHETPWPSYALACSATKNPTLRLAVGSCVEQESNRVQVIEVNEESKTFDLVAEAEHPFPPTKLMWNPPNLENDALGQLDLLASVSTALNLWKMEDGQLQLIKEFANTTQNAQNGALPPLTSFDWNALNHHRIGTASVDTTCTIWNLEKQRIETQLIAHDKAVLDIAFSQEFLFASVGADGSVRLFDLRNLEHSTIIYESTAPSPLLRLAWNGINKNHIATIAMNAPGVIIVDIRRPSVALAALSSNDSYVNHVAWAPHSRSHLLGGTSDGMALFWDVNDTQGLQDDATATGTSSRTAPVLAHGCSREVYQALWPTSQPDCMALGFARQVEVTQI